MTFNDIFNRYITPLEPVLTGCEPSGSPSHPVKALLFDIYGTLFISSSGEKSISADLKSMEKHLWSLVFDFNLSLTPNELLSMYAKATNDEYLRKKNRGVNWPEVEIDRIWQNILGCDSLETARMFALGFELIVNPVYPMPGLNEMLFKIRQTNVKTGIISNAQFYTPLTFEYFCGATPENLGFDPDLVFYSYRVKRAKPSMFLFETAAEILYKYGISPKKVLTIGNDMLNDISPAQREGFQTALFAGDKRSLRLREGDPDCLRIKPDIILTDLSQLPDMAGLQPIHYRMQSF